ncbi:MAG: hypothetical protein Q8N04_14890 [Nitrospira sp.]|nr:hypothetical protein [Nitrospira sp.]
MAEPKEKNGAIVDAKESVQQTARTRSPAYPGIGLETAIRRARELYAQEKLNPVPLTIAVKRWGFKEKSSGGLVAIAALKSFGLLKDSGSGKDRKLQLTDEARRILLDTRQESPERDQLIKEAALRPKIHNTLWKRWGTDLPSDENVQHALIFEWSFNENIVRDFLREYKDTILFSKLTDSDTISTNSGDKEEIVVGDYVQWESSGGIQFEAKRVTGFSGDGAFAFVEGTNTGFPLDELSKVQALNPGSEKGKFVQPIKSLPPKVGMNSDTFTLDEGQVILQWPAKMSHESYEDFKSWLDLVARKAKRAVDKPSADTNQS